MVQKEVNFDLQNFSKTILDLKPRAQAERFEYNEAYKQNEKYC